ANFKGRLVNGLAINIALSLGIHDANYYSKSHFHSSFESDSTRGFSYWFFTSSSRVLILVA
ncbi:hypothetical protein ABN262_23445, partial [Citrobacter youngae]|uniref:hypothetical protein n=1 Tax=Citrobacter youngae TaxID=133448 RepID=UPI0032DB61B4